MDSGQFVFAQFETLRREIEASKSKIFRTITFGMAGIPGMYFVSTSFNLRELILVIPMLVVVVGLLYLSEMHALMRCGRYIRKEIETKFPDIVGWEEWLADESHFDKRTVDKYLLYSFYLLSLIYFVATVLMAWQYAASTYSASIGGLVLGLYGAIGLFFGYFLVRNIRLSTTTTPRDTV